MTISLFPDCIFHRRMQFPLPTVLAILALGTSTFALPATDLESLSIIARDDLESLSIVSRADPKKNSQQIGNCSQTDWFNEYTPCIEGCGSFSFGCPGCGSSCVNICIREASKYLSVRLYQENMLMRWKRINATIKRCIPIHLKEIDS